VGLYIGVELQGDSAAARAVVEGLRARHVLIGTAGRLGNVLKLRPPLCFAREHADIVLQALEDVFF
jgi:4-aminobutyrate aminotransferase-like enzyme